MSLPEESKQGKRIPLLFWLALAFALLSLALHIACAVSTPFADVFQRVLTPPVRATLGYLSAILPLSVAEVFVALFPVWLGTLLLVSYRCVKADLGVRRMLFSLLAVPLLIYSFFVFTLGAGYLGSPLSEKLSLQDREPTAEALHETALLLAERANACLDEMACLPDGSTQMPYDYAEMNERLVAAYARLSERYAFLSHFSVGTKRVLLSEPMAYTHITGVYSFFTGEANVNTALPDYSTVYTAAHEMAHARGISRENEANFVAFLALETSDDPYLRYSGYMNLLQYVSNALYSADRALFSEAYAAYGTGIRAEFHAYNEVYARYEGSVASSVAESVNNAYLETMGTEGTVSYGLVVDLAVAYFAQT